MKNKILQWVAIILIVVTGYLHFITAAEEYVEAVYMGWLFFANFVGALVAAFGIFRRKLLLGWALGVVITAGSIVGYIQSRTFGMPGMEVEEWIHPIGLTAVAVEVLFLIVFGLAKPWADPDMNGQISAFGISYKRMSASPVFFPVILVVMILIGFFSYGLGTRSSHPDHPLPETVISAQTLEDEYGIEMMLVAVTAAGGLVDVRYKIIDPVKAAKLATEEDGIMPMIYVENGDIMLMPDAHMRTQKLVADRMYFTLIPNAKNIIKRGSYVTVVFGDIALEPMATQ